MDWTGLLYELAKAAITLVVVVAAAVFYGAWWALKGLWELVMLTRNAVRSRHDG
jgi:uncharacterized membrane-anchored protein